MYSPSWNGIGHVGVGHARVVARDAASADGRYVLRALRGLFGAYREFYLNPSRAGCAGELGYDAFRSEKSYTFAMMGGWGKVFSDWLGCC